MGDWFDRFAWAVCKPFLYTFSVVLHSQRCLSANHTLIFVCHSMSLFKRFPLISIADILGCSLQLNLSFKSCYTIKTPLVWKKSFHAELKELSSVCHLVYICLQNFLLALLTSNEASTVICSVISNLISLQYINKSRLLKLLHFFLMILYFILWLY